MKRNICHDTLEEVEFSKKIALYNKSYDAKIIEAELSNRFNQAYINDFYKDTENSKNNIVVFNFQVKDLKKNMSD